MLFVVVHVQILGKVACPQGFASLPPYFTFLCVLEWLLASSLKCSRASSLECYRVISKIDKCHLRVPIHVATSYVGALRKLSILTVKLLLKLWPDLITI